MKKTALTASKTSNTTPEVQSAIDLSDASVCDALLGPNWLASNWISSKGNTKANLSTLHTQDISASELSDLSGLSGSASDGGSTSLSSASQGNSKSQALDDAALAFIDIPLGNLKGMMNLAKQLNLQRGEPAAIESFIFEPKPTWKDSNYLQEALQAGHEVLRVSRLNRQPLLIGKGPLGQARGFFRGYWLTDEDAAAMLGISDFAAELWIKREDLETGLSYTYGKVVRSEKLVAYSRRGEFYMSMFEDTSIFFKLKDWLKLYGLQDHRRNLVQTMIANNELHCNLLLEWVKKGIRCAQTRKARGDEPLQMKKLRRAAKLEVFQAQATSGSTEHRGILQERPIVKGQPLIEPEVLFRHFGDLTSNGELIDARIKAFGFETQGKPDLDAFPVPRASEEDLKRSIELAKAKGFAAVNIPKIPGEPVCYQHNRISLYVCRNRLMNARAIADAFGIEVGDVHCWRRRTSEEEFEAHFTGEWIESNELPVFKRRGELLVPLIHDKSRYLPVGQWMLVYGAKHHTHARVIVDSLTGARVNSMWPNAYLTMLLAFSKPEDYALHDHVQGEKVKRDEHVAAGKKGTLAAWSLSTGMSVGEIHYRIEKNEFFGFKVESRKSVLYRFTPKIPAQSQARSFDETSAVTTKAGAVLQGSSVGNVFEPSQGSQALLPVQPILSPSALVMAQSCGSGKCGTFSGMRACLRRVDGNAELLCAACSDYLKDNLRPKFIQKGVAPYIFSLKAGQSGQVYYFLQTPEGLKTLPAATKSYNRPYSLCVSLITRYPKPTWAELDAALRKKPEKSIIKGRAHRYLGLKGKELADELMQNQEPLTFESDLHPTLKGRVLICQKTVFVRDDDGEWRTLSAFSENHNLGLNAASVLKRLKSGFSWDKVKLQKEEMDALLSRKEALVL